MKWNLSVASVMGFAIPSATTPWCVVAEATALNATISFAISAPELLQLQVSNPSLKKLVCFAPGHFKAEHMNAERLMMDEDTMCRIEGQPMCICHAGTSEAPQPLILR